MRELASSCLSSSSSTSVSSEMSGDVSMDDAPVLPPQYSSDVSMDDGGASDSQQKQDKSRTAMTNVAKFKAAQDLRIETANLPPSTGKTKARANSTGSLDLHNDAKTPVPPCSTGKKRRRRTAAQIDRKFACTYPSCTKAYGSEGSLTQHQRLKHRNQVPEPGTPSSQLSSFFLPLHRTPRSLPANLGRLTGPGGARTVNIRPAGMLDSAVMSLFDLSAAAAVAKAATHVPEHDTIQGDFGLPPSTEILSSNAAAALHNARQHLRARSNSMPVSSYSSASTSGLTVLPVYSSPVTSSLSTDTTMAAKTTTAPSPPRASAGKPQSSSSTRRSRPATTPRPAKPPLRRTKSRSKSESMHDLMAPPPFEFPLDHLIRPRMNDRSVSDSVAFELMAGEPPLPLDWSAASAAAACYRQSESSPASSVEDAIDCDILSVLAADCEDSESDAGDSTLEFMDCDGGGNGGSGTCDKADEWLNQPDAMYLSTHLERMTMLQPQDAATIPSPHGNDCNVHTEFPCVAIDSFPVTPFDPSPPPLGDGTSCHDALAQLDHESKAAAAQRGIVKLEPTVFHCATASSSTTVSTVCKSEERSSAAAAVATWTNELAALETYTTTDMDQTDFMDVDASSYGPLQWKSEKIHRFPATTAAAPISGLDSLSAYLHHTDKHTAESNGYLTLGDSYLLDGVPDYAMEEPRLGSPVVCQQDDL